MLGQLIDRLNGVRSGLVSIDGGYFSELIHHVAVPLELVSIDRPTFVSLTERPESVRNRWVFLIEVDSCFFLFIILKMGNLSHCTLHIEPCCSQGNLQNHSVLLRTVQRASRTDKG